MSPEAVTAERVYQDIKDAVLQSRYAPGAALNVHAIAQEHGTSISPIRDALHRLVGERLLTSRRSGGFEVTVLTVESASDLYRWHGFLVAGAARNWRLTHCCDDLVKALDGADSPDPDILTTVTIALFFRLGMGAESLEHLFAIRAAGERLNALRHCETQLPGRKKELRRLIELSNKGPASKLRAAIDRYHQKRLHHVSEIVDCLRRDPRASSD
jgi:hypothetical protein